MKSVAHPIEQTSQATAGIVAPNLPVAVPDSLPDAGTTEAAAPALEYPLTATASQMFGTESRIAEPQPTALPAPMMDGGAVQTAILLLTAAYLLFVSTSTGEIRALWKMTSLGRTKSDRILQSQGGNYDRFLRIAMWMIWLPTISLALLRLCAEYLPSLPESARLHGLAAALLAVAALTAFQYAALRLSGSLTLTQPFTASLLHLKRIFIALASVLLCPLLLCWTIAPFGGSDLLTGLLATGSVVLVGLYLKESFALFRSKNISILHWILYLCTVEIFPVSLLWLMALKF